MAIPTAVQAASSTSAPTIIRNDAKTSEFFNECRLIHQPRLIDAYTNNTDELGNREKR